MLGPVPPHTGPLHMQVTGSPTLSRFFLLISSPLWHSAEVLPTFPRPTRSYSFYDKSSRSCSVFPLGGFPGGTSGKESACQCRRLKRHGFDPWVHVGKIPWNRKWKPTPVFLVGYSPWSRKESDTTEHSTTVMFAVIVVSPELRVSGFPIILNKSSAAGEGDTPGLT